MNNLSRQPQEDWSYNFTENKENIPPSLSHSYKYQETAKPSRQRSIPLEEVIYSEYGYNLESSLKEHEFSTQGCLDRHLIPVELRAKMIDWMVEVLSIFHCEDNTLFKSVRLMDVYFLNCTRRLNLEDIHGIGIACMFIASKYEDVRALKMKTVYNKIGHRKYTKPQIASMEREVLSTVHYYLHFSTIHEFLDIFLRDSNSSVRKTALVIAELSLFSYELSGVKPSYLAAAIALYTHRALNISHSVVPQGPLLQILNKLANFLEEFADTYGQYKALEVKHSIRIVHKPDSLIEIYENTIPP